MPSLLDQFIAASAEALMLRAQIPDPLRPAFHDLTVRILHAQAAQVFGGERVYAPRRDRVARQDRDARIVAALEAGSPAVEIARRERVSPSLVRYVGRCRGKIMP